MSNALHGIPHRAKARCPLPLFLWLISAILIAWTQRERDDRMSSLTDRLLHPIARLKRWLRELFNNG
jgi:hypothetical protein